MALNERIAKILIKQFDQELSPDEKHELEQWWAASPENKKFLEDLRNPEQLLDLTQELEKSKKEVWSRLQTKIPELNVVNPLDALEQNSSSRIAYLIDGYNQERLTVAEHDELDEWVAANDLNLQIFEEMTDENNEENIRRWIDEKSEAKIERRTPRPLRLWLYGIAAGIAVIILAVAIEKIIQNNTD